MALSSEPLSDAFFCRRLMESVRRCVAAGAGGIPAMARDWDVRRAVEVLPQPRGREEAQAEPIRSLAHDQPPHPRGFESQKIVPEGGRRECETPHPQCRLTVEHNLR